MSEETDSAGLEDICKATLHHDNYVSIQEPNLGIQYSEKVYSPSQKDISMSEKIPMEEYSECEDAIYCYHCRHFSQNRKEPTFVSQGYDIQILEQIKQKLHEAEYFTILADESKDASKKEQVVVAVGYCYKNTIHEEFIGIAEAQSLDADGLSDTIIHQLRRVDANMKNCVGKVMMVHLLSLVI
ncbi:Zinc finger MYM-type protein 1-like [Oopsacas minuta]|uniref:Zinc finger MYM-type protein 1-like n=1 Tax=Oopsacas minuta TaxID=111878 RepID=A0AAV7KH58_9METZ|nr:Zinc finger MYM-type protein 1-like [Oopsacas minuta]